MSIPSTTSASSTVPTQIWEALNSDLQERVIRLLIQLTVDLLVAQTDSSAKKEDCHAQSSKPSENPD
jgi:hypothetical protein